MVKVAITGSTGLIGSRIIELLKGDFNFIELVWPKFDVTKKDDLWKTLKDLNFDIFFHLAGYTNVDDAEKNPGKKIAYKINVDGTKNVFEIVMKRRRKFIYVSTDFVFNGKNPHYYEESIPNPISYYAKTKYEGETVVKNYAMIVRFSYPYRAFFETKKDFVRGIKFKLEQKKQLNMVNNSLMTPTFIDDIAYAMKYLCKNYTPEIFHLVGGNSISPFSASKIIAKTFGLDQSLIHATTYEQYFKNRAKRPQYSEIKTKKNNFYRFKDFEQGLQIVKSQILNLK